MDVLRRFVSALKFRTVPTTILVVLIYFTVFTSVLISDELPDVPQPKYQRGLNIDQADLDLHKIAVQPHPFNSHANDVVRSYLLSRLHDIVSRYSDYSDSKSHICIWDDLISNASWVMGYREGTATYFEGTNILVKIDGTDPEYLRQGGVLFSAHYDSVSTAPGVSDDGMGVTTLLQLVELFARNRPKRTAVFNFNNGEEDGLHGAHVFLEHPWATFVDTFLNLEGAAAGGRPLLFRATSSAPLSAFLAKYVPHPHSNVMAADGFSLGLVRSDTDYTVYNGPASRLQGLDFAFYKGRSLYHTKWDAIPTTEGGRKALWAMMEAAAGAGHALLNEKRTHETGEDAVYFDLFASTLVVFPLLLLFALNIVFLVIGPILLLLSILSKELILRGRLGGNVDSAEPSWIWAWRSFTKLEWLKPVWGRTKFWLAVVVVLASESILLLCYVKLNPFIIYSHQHLVVISFSSLAYLSIVLPLRIRNVSGQPLLPEQEKLTVLLQTYIFSWLLLLGATIAVGKWKLGGVYFLTAWNCAVLISLVLGILEVLAGAKGTSESDTTNGQRRVRGVRHEVDETAPPAEGGAVQQEEQVEAEPTEITPLIAQRRSRTPPPSRVRDADGGEPEGAIGWWLVQALIAIPLPLMLTAHLMVLLLASLSQTLSDGSSPIIVYGAIAFMSVLFMLPLAPFSVKLSRYLTIVMAVVFVLTTVYAWLVFPFNQAAPLKIYFQQRIQLDGGKVVSANTKLTGVSRYLRPHIISELPSSWSKEVKCENLRDLRGSTRLGFSDCLWDSSSLLPSTGRSRYAESGFAGPVDWFYSSAQRLNESSVRITVKGTNTRNCRIYFDEPITRFEVAGSHKTKLRRGWDDIGDGLKEVMLWSRTWDREFVVDVDALEGKALTGAIACDWNEYESGTAGGIGTGGKIPAFEEVLAFLPKWAIASKRRDGLVLAWTKFSA